MEIRAGVAALILIIMSGGTALAGPYTYTEIDDPLGTEGTDAFGINDAGTVSGTYTTNTGTYGFVYSNGNYTTIADPTALAGSTFVYGINNNGTVIGRDISTSDFNEHLFLETAGVYTDVTIGAFSHDGSQAYGVNDAGAIAGTDGNSTGLHGFVESAGTLAIIDDPLAKAPIFTNGPLVDQTSVLGVNNAGVLVGSYSTATGSHGFVYQGGAFTVVDDPLAGLNGISFTDALGINNAGAITGIYQDSTNGVISGFVDVAGVFSTIVVPDETDTAPYGINDNGLIVGSYTDNVTGQDLSFIATPVPEPASIVLLGAGMLLFVAFRRYLRG